MQATAQAPVHPGDILADKYRVERILGVGGMGVVVAATHLHLEQLVALKFMLPQALQVAGGVERFLREARAAVRLKSEHVARVLDVGMLRDGSPYIVMEYLEGMDLAMVLHQSRALPAHIVADYVIQACSALAEAHAMGIVHRDIKPANLYLIRRPDGTAHVKILDFGIAKAQTTNAAMTSTAMVMGSPAYMSPEQMRSAKAVDARTDIWALGVILYECVAGRPPWEGESLTELCLKVTLEPPPPLPPMAGPPGFEQVVRRAMEKDPGQRYQTVGELAGDLAHFAPAAASLLPGIRALVGVSAASSSRPVTVPPTAPPTMMAYPPAATMMDPGPAQAAPRRSRAPLWVALGVLAVGGAVGAVAAMNAGSPAKPAAAAAPATSQPVAPAPTPEAPPPVPATAPATPPAPVPVAAVVTPPAAPDAAPAAPTAAEAPPPPAPEPVVEAKPAETKPATHRVRSKSATTAKTPAKKAVDPLERDD